MICDTDTTTSTTTSKTVTWKNTCNIRTYTTEMAHQDRFNAWYQPTDYSKFKTNCKKICQLAREFGIDRVEKKLSNETCFGLERMITREASTLVVRRRNAAWQAVCAGVLIPLSFVVIRRRLPAPPRGWEGTKIIAAGIFGTLGYCIAVWAMSLSSMGGVSAIRETSILFAALFGVVMLRERITLSKLAGALSVTAGVIFLSLS